MNKVIGLKLTDKDKKLIKQIEDSGLSNSELIRKAMDQYFKSINSVNPPVNQIQQEKQEKTVNQVNQSVNHKIQISENYELMEYLKRDNEWLKERIEHFEHTQDHIFAKVVKPDGKAKKETLISLYRM